MAAVTGVDFLIKVNTGTVESPVWTAIGGQRGATLKLGTDKADITSKDSGGWAESLITYRNWSIDFDGLLLEDDGAFGKLEDCYFNATQVQVRLSTAAGSTYDGFGILTDLSIEMPYDGEATISGTVEGTGTLTKTAA